MRFIITTLFLATTCLSASAQLLLKNFREVGESVAYKDYLYFAANDDTHGMELWRTDGTPENTVLIKDIKLGKESSGPQSFLVYEGQLLFLADDAQHGVEVWTTDGTPENTRLLVDFVPGTASFIGRNWTVYQDHLLILGGYDDTIYEVFPAENRIDCFPADCDKQAYAASLFITERALYSYSDYRHELAVYNDEEQRFETLNTAGFERIDRVRYTGEQLYVAGVGKVGTLNETTREFTELASWPLGRYDEPEIDNLIGVGELLFFSVRLDYDSGDEKDSDGLWVTDGTPAGTKLLKSFLFSSHWSNSEIMNFIEANGKLYFAGSSVGHTSSTLWTSDGTPAGTQEVADVPVRKYDDRDDVVAKLTAQNNRIYFNSGNALGIYNLSYTDSLYLFQGDFTQLSFKQVVGEHFYFAGGGQFHQDLWVDDPQPKIMVSRSQVIFDKVAVDSCLQEDVRITNIGRKNLYLSEVSISGNAFYVNSDSSSSQLRPGSYVDLRLFYFPDTTGLAHGQLNIYSNDRSQPIVDVPLEGSARSRLPEDTSYCARLEAVSRQVVLSKPSEAVLCSNSVVDENVSPGTVIGQLATVELSGELTFSLVSGEGDRDNRYFSIEADQLYVSVSPDFERTSVMSLRVRAESSQEAVEGVLLITVNDKDESAQVSDCGPVRQYLDQGLEDVAFWDERTAIAVGPNTIVKSTDGGTTWTDVNPNLPPDLYRRVIAPGDGNLYVAGSAFLLRSVDVGEHWQVLEFSEADEAITDLSFPDQHHGFISTLAGNIYRTSDQGQSWKHSGAVEIQSRMYDRNNISSLAFGDSLVGFAGDTRGKLYQTTSGGQDWNEVSLNGINVLGEVVHLQILSQSIVFMVNRKGAAYRTTTGGENWIPVAPQYTDITHLHMVSPSEGYFFREDDGLYQTKDGGNQWSQVHEVGGAMRGMAESPQSQRLVAVGRSIDNYSSSDVHHKLIISAQNDQWQTISYFPFGESAKLQWTNNSVGYTTLRQYSGHTTAYRTNDAGLTWRSFPLPVNEEGTLSAYDEQVLYYTTYDKLYETTNGGDSWQEKANDLYIKSVVFADESTLFAATHDRVVKSTDGGSNWETALAEEDIEHWSSIVFINESTGFVRSGGKIMKTEDQGRSWEVVFSDEEVYIGGFQFIDTNLGFVWSLEIDYDTPVEFYRTTNGGDSWERIQRQNNQSKLSPLFLDSERGWASYGNRVYYTQDGGRNWQEKYYTSASTDIDLLHNGENLVIYNSDAYHNEGVLQKIIDNANPALAGNIIGERNVVPGNTHHYQAQLLEHTKYQWSAVGGTIRRTSDHEVWVNWDETATERSLTLTHSDGCGATNTSRLDVAAVPERVIVINEDLTKEEDTITGIDENEPWLIIAYPNPVEQLLHIDQKSFGESIERVRVINSQGQYVPAIYQSTAYNFSIDFLPLEPGLYIVEAIGNSRRKTFKIIKK